MTLDFNEVIEKQIEQQKKSVDYDTREFTIEILVDKYWNNIDEEKNEIFVPDYQREFTWDEKRQSKFIESIILNLPVPLMFLAENKEGRMEIVDGSQRIRTLSAFLRDELELVGLLKLSNLNGLTFSRLPKSRQRKIKNSPMRTIVLRDNTTEEVKNDIFERINRGSDPLYSMEKRKGIFKGEFNDFIYKECAINDTFKRLTPLATLVTRRQEHEELILRFFGLYDAYPQFSFTKNMGVASYLDIYLQSMNDKVKKDPNLLQEKRNLFNKMLTFVSNTFPYGFEKRRGAGQVSRTYFEAISIGVALALKENPNLCRKQDEILKWLTTYDLINLTSGKYRTHSKQRIRQRIDYVKEKLLNGE